MGQAWKTWFEERSQIVAEMKLSDQKYWTKADVLALSGLSYGRQAEFAHVAGIKMQTVRVSGAARQVYLADDLVTLLKAVGFTEHELDGVQVLLNLKRIIEL